MIARRGSRGDFLTGTLSPQKIDSFLDAKTRALDVLDDSNRAKNAVFGIDSSQSATTQFLSNLVSQKIQAATGSIGPVINSATTLLSGASAGLSNAFASKLAPLSALSGGLSGGAGAGAGAGVAAGAYGISEFASHRLPERGLLASLVFAKFRVGFRGKFRSFTTAVSRRRRRRGR